MTKQTSPSVSKSGKHRRRFLRGAAGACLAAFGGGADSADGAPPPKDSGLSFEGLLKGKPGFQPRKLAPPPVSEIPGFLSKAQLQSSYAAYRKAFERLLAAERALRGDVRGAAAASRYAALRAQQIGAANSVLLHEFYFRNLTAKAIAPSGYVRSNMSEHIGSMDTWREDFTACARVADAWAVLVYDPYDDRWHDLPLGAADAGGLAGANPLVVCSVAQNAWAHDYDEREAYIARFLEHIDWSVVASRYHAVDRH